MEYVAVFARTALAKVQSIMFKTPVQWVLGCILELAAGSIQIAVLYRRESVRATKWLCVFLGSYIYQNPLSKMNQDWLIMVALIL